MAFEPVKKMQKRDKQSQEQLMDNTDHNLVPPLTFRLYQSVKFDRPVDPKKHFVAPGSCEVKMLEEDGIERIVSFDFESYEGGVDPDDPCIVHCEQKNPDFTTFKDMETITEHMLRNITEIFEWNIEVDGMGEWESIPQPLEITEAEFIIINDSAMSGILFLRIPIETPIVPTTL